MSGTENQVGLPECGRTDLLAYRAGEKVVKTTRRRNNGGFRIKW